MTFKYHNH